MEIHSCDVAADVTLEYATNGPPDAPSVLTTAELTSSPALVWTMTALVRLLGASGTGRLAGLAVKDRAVGRRIAELMSSADPVAVRLLTENIAHYDHTPTLRASTVPMLLLRCELDRSINRNLASTLAALEGREDAEVVDLAGAGHFANLEQPGAFDAALGSFLDRHR